MRKIQELFVEITYNCLLQCKHCSSEAYPGCELFISAERMYSLIDEAISLGLQKLSLSGGEPLLHPDCLNIIEYAKQRGLTVCVYSCGVYSENLKLTGLPNQLLKQLKKLELDKLILSVHGADKKTHEEITGVFGSFEYVIETLERAIDVGLETEIHFVPTRINYLQIPELVYKLRNLGVHQISILRLVQQGRGRENEKELALTADEGFKIVQTVKQLNAQYADIKIRIGAPFNCVNLDNAVPCNAAQNKLLISANGEIFPCEAFKHLKGHMLNLFDHSIQFIWEQDLLLNQLRELSYKKIEGCKNCKLVSKCKGGCPGERMLFNGDIAKGPEVWCQI